MEEKHGNYGSKSYNYTMNEQLFDQSAIDNANNLSLNSNLVHADNNLHDKSQYSDMDSNSLDPIYEGVIQLDKKMSPCLEGKNLIDYTKSESLTHLIENSSDKRTLLIYRKNGRCGFTIKTYAIFNNETKKSFFLTYVHYVENDGPAFESGLFKGDMLLCINNCKLINFSNNRVQDILRLATSPLKLLVCDDQHKTIKLIKRQIKLNDVLNAKMLELKNLENLESTILSDGSYDSRSFIASNNLQDTQPYYQVSKTSLVNSENIIPNFPQVQSIPRYSLHINKEWNPAHEMSTYDIAASNYSLPLRKRDIISRQRPTFSLPNGYNAIEKKSRSLEASPFIIKKNDTVRVQSTIGTNDSKMSTLVRKLIKQTPSCRSTSTWYVTNPNEMIVDPLDNHLDNSISVLSPRHDHPRISRLSQDNNNNTHLSKVGGSVRDNCRQPINGVGELSLNSEDIDKRKYTKSFSARVKGKPSSSGLHSGLRIICNGIGSMFDLSSLSSNPNVALSRVFSADDLTSHESKTELEITRL